MVTGMKRLRDLKAVLPVPPAPAAAPDPVPTPQPGATAPLPSRRSAALELPLLPTAPRGSNSASFESVPPRKGRTSEASQVQTAIDAFVTADGPEITADDRETSSRVVEHLSNLGARLRIERLAQGDYLAGDRILVERKTARDFVDTLVERDLFGQVKELAAAAARPVLVIEGGDIYTARDVNPAAIRGALAAIAIDLGVAIFSTRDELETAQLILTLARREEGERGEHKVHPYKSYRSLKEQQEYIIAAFPQVGLKNARLLLSHFGSVKAVLDADEEALRAVKGIGEKTARLIFETSRQLYR